MIKQKKNRNFYFDNIMRFRKIHILLMFCIALALTTTKAQNSEINVALSKWGTTAKASSFQKDIYAPSYAIDGKWIRKAKGTSRKYLWNSKPGQSENWLAVDFGKERNIHKIIVRHEGVYEKGEEYNISDFKLQASGSLDGPWHNLTAPVINNRLDVSVHEFNPQKTRYVRLWIDKAEQNANVWARVHELEVYADISEEDMLVASELFPNVIRNGESEEEVKLELNLYPKASVDSYENLSVSLNRSNIIINKDELKIDKSNNGYFTEVWLPVSSLTDTVKIDGLRMGKQHLLRKFPPLGSRLNKWGYLANGEVYIVCSSHQDIAWEDSPEHTANYRTSKCILPAMERMKKRDDVTFSMENVLYIEEFLDRKPELKDEIFQFTVDGKFDWGATYNQTYESLLSGEQLVRQVYLGAKKIRKMIPGTSAKVAYSVDVPGRSLQMPQILAKANVPYFLFSRHERGLFNWESPDGSSILCWSMGHYYDASSLGFVSDTPEFLSIVEGRARAWEPIYEKQNNPPVNGVLYSMDYIGPADFDKYLDDADEIRKEMKKNGVTDDSPYYPPVLKYTSSEQFFNKIANSNASLPTIKGERPNVWLYIHGPSHHWAISSKRAAGVLLPAAESFTTINGLLEGSLTDYQHEKFDEAWAASIYDDHGWGGNNGHITDEVFKGKLDFAKEQGQQMLNNALTRITEKINTDDQKGEAIVLFNALSWERTDPVTATVKSKNNNFSIVDMDGKKVDHQIIEKRNGEFVISFIAEDIPSLGYKTYYVSKSVKNTKEEKIDANDTNYDNKFYSIKFSNGGLSEIYDKELGKELLNVGKFKAGEIFTMKSEGNGAGEFSDVQKLEMEGFDKVSLHNSEWTLVENGSVFAKYELKQKLTHCTVNEEIVVYHNIKRIDCNVSLLDWDGTKSREFRFALPLQMDDFKVTYEVPMGTVTIGEDEIDGAAGGMYPIECKDTHPREVQNFISTNNKELGVTLSSSVAVFDHIDPTDNPEAYPIIQPVLLASRKSCHANGNWYLQEGDHHYNFSIFSHVSGWENGYKNAIQANNPLVPINSKNKKADLPGMKSFFSVSQPNTLISTVKKCDDDENVVIRLFDIEGKDCDVELKAFFDISKAEQTNIIEEEGKEIQANKKVLKTKVGHHAIETFKIAPKK